MKSTAVNKPSYADLEAKNELLQSEVTCLKHELQELRRLIFSQKRERFVPEMPPEQLDFALEETAAKQPSEKTENISYTRRKKQKSKKTPTRNPLPEHLPRKEIVIKPAEDTSGLKKIGEEITEELEYEPAKLFVNRYVRPKYARPESDDEQLSGVIIGTLPSRPIEKGIAGPGLLAHVAIGKFVDHLPLYRQQQQFKRLGVEIASSTLSDWIKATCELLEPLYELLRMRVLSTDYLMADETPIKVLDRQKKKGKTHKGFHWVYYSPLERLALFDYQEGRSSKNPNRMLKKFQGFLQTDGYKGYNGVSARSDVVAVGCMAHARRYFVKAKSCDPNNAEWMLTHIQSLYQIEKELRENGFAPEYRYQIRQKYALPILAEIRAWLDEKAKRVLPKSVIGEAITYMNNQWRRLERYTTDGRLEIDNNLVENQIRPVALGRKNYLFAGSHNGARWAAMIYSLVATAKQHRVEPLAYLKDILSRIADHPYNKLAQLLPPEWEPITK